MTDKPMTQEELDRLAQLANAATPGPWDKTRDCAGFPPGHIEAEWYKIVHPTKWEVFGPVVLCALDSEPDAAFIAAAREAVPRLIEEVKRMQKRSTGIVKFKTRVSNQRRTIKNHLAEIEKLKRQIVQLKQRTAKG